MANNILTGKVLYAYVEMQTNINLWVYLHILKQYGQTYVTFSDRHFAVWLCLLKIGVDYRRLEEEALYQSIKEARLMAQRAEEERKQREEEEKQRLQKLQVSRYNEGLVQTYCKVWYKRR